MCKSQLDLLNLFSAETIHYLNLDASEEHCPRNNADQMDNLIANSTRKAEQLRKIRYALENILQGNYEKHK